MRVILFLAAVALAACDRDRPPTPSTEQHGQLDEAESMLNDMATNEEGPETEASDPSANAN